MRRNDRVPRAASSSSSILALLPWHAGAVHARFAGLCWHMRAWVLARMHVWRTCPPVAKPLAGVGGEQLVDEVTALGAHVFGVFRPSDVAVQNVVKDLLGGVGIEGRDACARVHHTRGEAAAGHPSCKWQGRSQGLKRVASR